MWSDHLIRYRSKTTEELEALLASYEAQETNLSQQAMGTKSFTRDLHILDDKMQAIAYVLRERGALEPIKVPVNIGVGITDFSDIK